MFAAALHLAGATPGGSPVAAAAASGNGRGLPLKQEQQKGPAGSSSTLISDAGEELDPGRIQVRGATLQRGGGTELMLAVIIWGERLRDREIPGSGVQLLLGWGRT